MGILSTMRSILTAQYSPLELIVINDGSTDTSDQKIRAFIFSRKREHGKVHSWIVLPLIRLNHFSVLLQILCKYALLAFCVVTHQYTTLMFAMILIAIIVTISLLSDKDYRETALLSPIAWILLEIPNCVYAIAFLQVWWNYLRKKRQTWQRWNREGILT